MKIQISGGPPAIKYNITIQFQPKSDVKDDVMDLFKFYLKKHIDNFLMILQYEDSAKPILCSIDDLREQLMQILKLDVLSRYVDGEDIPEDIMKLVGLSKK